MQGFLFTVNDFHIQMFRTRSFSLTLIAVQESFLASEFKSSPKHAKKTEICPTVNGKAAILVLSRVRRMLAEYLIEFAVFPSCSFLNTTLITRQVVGSGRNTTKANPPRSRITCKSAISGAVNTEVVVC